MEFWFQDFFFPFKRLLLGAMLCVHAGEPGFGEDGTGTRNVEDDVSLYYYVLMYYYSFVNINTVRYCHYFLFCEMGMYEAYVCWCHCLAACTPAGHYCGLYMVTCPNSCST